MLKNRSRRHALAALGGVLILSGVGTMGTAYAIDFGATLSGENLPDGGDRDGWGRAQVEVSDARDTICADLEVRSIGPVTAATIHRGAQGVTGPPLVTLDRPDGEDRDEDDCDSIGDTLADEIQANPAEFYVLIATADHPNGALRGQLVPAAD